MISKIYLYYTTTSNISCYYQGNQWPNLGLFSDYSPSSFKNMLTEMQVGVWSNLACWLYGKNDVAQTGQEWVVVCSIAVSNSFHATSLIQACFTSLSVWTSQRSSLYSELLHLYVGIWGSNWWIDALCEWVSLAWWNDETKLDFFFYYIMRLTHNWEI